MLRFEYIARGIPKSLPPVAHLPAAPRGRASPSFNCSRAASRPRASPPRRRPPGPAPRRRCEQRVVIIEIKSDPVAGTRYYTVNITRPPLPPLTQPNVRSYRRTPHEPAAQLATCTVLSESFPYPDPAPTRRRVLDRTQPPPCCHASPNPCPNGSLGALHAPPRPLLRAGRGPTPRQLTSSRGSRASSVRFSLLT